VSLRTAAVGTALAIFGLGAAVGIGLAANSISGDSVGLSAEPLSAGDSLAAPPAGRRAGDGAQRRAGRRGDRRPAGERQPAAAEPPAEAAPAPAEPAAPPVEVAPEVPEDSSGSGSSGSSGSSDSGQGRGRGRGRGRSGGDSGSGSDD
jgi:hypothetical protein